MSRDISVFASPEDLAAAAAELWISLANEALQENRELHVALSGGSTPKRLFRLLAEDSYANRMPWDKVQIYFGDERFVSHEHPDSNYLMASENLLSLVPIPGENVHPINTGKPDAASAADDYQNLLQTALPLKDKLSQFDLVFLGLGADGHTASLFPNTAVLKQQKKLVEAVYVEKMNSWRITLTYPIINQARHCVFLVEGESKADIIHELLSKNIDTYPAAKINPRGELKWMLDQQAASKLENN